MPYRRRKTATARQQIVEKLVEKVGRPRAVKVKALLKQLLPLLSLSSEQEGAFRYMVETFSHVLPSEGSQSAEDRSPSAAAPRYGARHK